MKRLIAQPDSAVPAPRRVDPDKAFYILWNPESHKPPRVQFETWEAARNGAVAIAQRTGQTFYVCKAVSVTCVDTRALE